MGQPGQHGQLILPPLQSHMYIVKEGKALNFGSHTEKLGVNNSQTSTNGSPELTLHQVSPGSGHKD